MFVNRILFRYENVACFFLTFLNSEMFITFLKENSEMCHQIVKFWAAKATKIMRTLYLFRNADFSKKFAKTSMF